MNWYEHIPAITAILGITLLICGGMLLWAKYGAK